MATFHISRLLLWLALAGAAWGIVAGMAAVAYLDARGVKVNFLALRIFWFRYMSEYRRRTLEETGRAGPLFYHAVAPFAIALVLVAVAMALRWR